MRVRYYAPDGTAVPSEGEELWRRLEATPADATAASHSSEKRTGQKTEDGNEGIQLEETFNALIAAKSELLLLHGLLNQLEFQSTLGVTFVRDQGSEDDFLFQRNKQKLIRADEKRRQMEEAAGILSDIHASLEAQVKTERTFYRELIGLSRFHSVCIQPTALSPFQVDLSVRSAWNVELQCEPLLVDLQPDSEGHVSISSHIPHPSSEEVARVLDTVEQRREQTRKEFNDLEELAAVLLEEYKKQVEAGGSQRKGTDLQRKRVPSLADPIGKRQRIPQQNRSITLDLPSNEETSLSREEQSGKDTFKQKAMSLELDIEDEELLVSSEEGESDSSSEGLAPTFALTEPLREEWFSRKELFAMTKVHMALCNLQFNKMWDICKTTLRIQADKANLRPAERNFLDQAIISLETSTLEALCFRTTLFMRFVQSLYRLPPFLHQIDMRDLPFTAKEKVLLLSKPLPPQQQGQNDEMETGEKEIQMPSMTEEDEEWIAKFRQVQFFRLRFQDTAPPMQALLQTFLNVLEHYHCLHSFVWPCLRSIPHAVTHVAHSPGALSSEIHFEIPGRFSGTIFVDSIRILVQGVYLRDHACHQISPIQVENGRIEEVIRALME